MVVTVVPAESYHASSIREGPDVDQAIKTDYPSVLADKVNVVPTVDGNGQMDLSQLPRLLDPIVEDETDYAKGNRLLYKELCSDMPSFRFFGNSILTFLTKIASGYRKTMDPQKGYTAISHDALDNVGIKSIYEYYSYCNDLLVKLNAKGMRVADVAIPAVYGDEESCVNHTTYIRKVSEMLLGTFLWLLKTRYLMLDFYPLVLFYVFGAGIAELGVAGMLWLLYDSFITDDPLIVRASLSLMIFTLGSMVLMIAILFDIQVNKDGEVQVHDYIGIDV